MTMQISAYGRLTKAPREINTSTGNMMVVCYLAVKVPPNDKNADEEMTEFFDVLAFGKIAETLMRHDVGDCISVIGNTKYKEYNGQRQFVIMADGIVSAKTVRPNTGKKAHKAAKSVCSSKAKQIKPTSEAVRAALEILKNAETVVPGISKSDYEEYENNRSAELAAMPFDDHINFGGDKNE